MSLNEQRLLCIEYRRLMHLTRAELGKKLGDGISTLKITRLEATGLGLTEHFDSIKDLFDHWRMQRVEFLYTQIQYLESL